MFKTCHMTCTKSDQIGRFLKVLSSVFSFKSSPNIWQNLGYFENHHSLMKNDWTSFWQPFGNIWAIFFNIWSHDLHHPILMLYFRVEPNFCSWSHECFWSDLKRRFLLLSLAKLSLVILVFAKKPENPLRRLLQSLAWDALTRQIWSVLFTSCCSAFSKRYVC